MAQHKLKWMTMTQRQISLAMGGTRGYITSLLSNQHKLAKSMTMSQREIMAKAEAGGGRGYITMAACFSSTKISYYIIIIQIVHIILSLIEINRIYARRRREEEQRNTHTCTQCKCRSIHRFQ